MCNHFMRIVSLPRIGTLNIARTHALTNTHTSRRTKSHKQTNRQTHTHTHADAQIHTHRHTHTFSHSHTLTHKPHSHTGGHIVTYLETLKTDRHSSMPRRDINLQFL